MTGETRRGTVIAAVVVNATALGLCFLADAPPDKGPVRWHRRPHGADEGTEAGLGWE